MISIFRPVKTNWETQGFGENRACRNPRNNHVVTKKGRFCPAGYQDFYKGVGMEGHNGYDLSTWHGEPLYFPVDADVEWWMRAERDSGGGVGVDVFSKEPIYFSELPKHAGKLAQREWKENNGMVYVKFRFWHLKSVVVGEEEIQVGTFSDGRPQMAPKVELGQLIGYCDSTGASSGDHLHWSMKIVASNSMTLDNDNGYYGAVEFPVNAYENTFIGEVMENLEKQILSLSEQVQKLILTVRAYIARDILKK